MDKVQAALFNRDFIEGNVNSDVIDIGEHALLVVHVDEYVAPAPKKFEEVESLVKDRVLLSNSANAAKEVADKVLADIKAGASLKPYIDAQQIVVSAEQTLDRTATASVDVAVLNNLFAMPVAPIHINCNCPPIITPLTGSPSIKPTKKPVTSGSLNLHSPKKSPSIHVNDATTPINNACKILTSMYTLSYNTFLNKVF